MLFDGGVYWAWSVWTSLCDLDTCHHHSKHQKGDTVLWTLNCTGPASDTEDWLFQILHDCSCWWPWPVRRLHSKLCMTVAVNRSRTSSFFLKLNLVSKWLFLQTETCSGNFLLVWFMKEIFITQVSPTVLTNWNLFRKSFAVVVHEREIYNSGRPTCTYNWNLSRENFAVVVHRRHNS